ncbi:MAG: hypothetical protein U5L96_21640 [Owenweeksia sp.]|nr:hypothetical protein [Owenweeksia sp.]
MVIPINQINLGIFSIRAYVCDDAVGSVEFLLDGFSFNVDNGDPYSINGNSGNSYNPWNADSGMHQITAIPFSNSNANGTQGVGLTINVLVIDTGFTDTTGYGSLPNLICGKAPAGRIALSFDGNLHDS